MTMLADDADLVIGVDTHRDAHTASAVSSPAGIVLEQFTCSTDAAGLAELVAFADQHPGRRVWAVEGTGGYGVGLHRMLVERGERVVETERPHRPGRRGGRSDSIDATKGAREALAAENPAQPRERGDRAALATLLAVARRIRALDAEARAHEHAMRTIITAWRPDLLDQLGVGTIVAATILCAWSHPGRFRSEAAFASLAGTAPLDASSGRQFRHRLNREGNRQLNRAFYTIVISRLHYDPATREYARRRSAEGKTGPEIRRCLQR
jgi:transposase